MISPEIQHVIHDAIATLKAQGHRAIMVPGCDPHCVRDAAGHRCAVAQVLYGKGGDRSDAPFDHGVRQLNTLYQRHADEFPESMSALVKMQTAGGTQDVTTP